MSLSSTICWQITPIRRPRKDSAQGRWVCPEFLLRGFRSSNCSLNFDGVNNLRQKPTKMLEMMLPVSESGGGQVWSAFPQKNHGKRFNCPKIVWRNRCRFFLGWEAGVPEVGYPSPLWVCSSPIAGVRLVPANRGFHCGDLPSSSVPGCKTMRNYYWQVAYRSFMTDNPVLGARH
jgi:hypothetical protein